MLKSARYLRSFGEGLLHLSTSWLEYLFRSRFYLKFRQQKRVIASIALCHLKANEIYPKKNSDTAEGLE